MAENGPIVLGVQVDAEKAATEMEQFSKKSRTALTSLSLVLQDLPFGFIAIQNNLPALFTSFAQLDTKSKGLKGVFNDLANSLEGPNGLVFGVSAAVAISTVLIQKYGSLGGAVDAFIGKTITATDIQNKLNTELEDSVKSSAGEIANLNNLVSILTDVNSTRSQQIGAFDELNKKYPGLLANINAENATSAASIELLSARLGLYKQQIFLEGRREALTKLVGESAYEGEKAIASLTNRNNLGFFEKFGLELRGLFAGIGGLGVINVLNQDLGNAVALSDSYSNSLEILTDQLTGVNGEISLLIKNQKEEAAAAKKAADQAAKKVKEPKGKKSSKAKIEKEEALRLEQIRVENLYNAKKKIKEQAELNQTELENLRALSKERNKAKRETGIILPTQISGVVPSFNNEKFLSSVRAANNELERLKEQANLQATYDLINSTFFSPISNLFEEFLNTGKFTFSEFGKAVLKAINQIVSRIIATGIVSLLFTIFSGGFGAAKGGAANGFQKVLGLVTSSLGFGGPAKIGGPNLANINPGGVQMSGQVVFVQRGSDLVGVLNRTNGTINRVG